MDKSRLIGLGWLLICCAVTAGITFWLARLPISTEQGLGFAGSILGSAIAVFGAVYALEWDRWRRQKENQTAVASLIEQALYWFDKLQAPDADKDVTQAQLKSALALSSAIETLKSVRSHFPAQNLGMAMAYATIDNIHFDPEAFRSDASSQLFYGGKTELSPNAEICGKLLRKALDEVPIHSMKIAHEKKS